MKVADALARTFLLMRDYLRDDVPDDALLEALRTTTVALVADEENLVSHSAQSAFVTAAVLMARCGMRVHLVAPNCDLVGPQPPMDKARLIDGLVDLASNLLPGFDYRTEVPSESDLTVTFGDTPELRVRGPSIRIGADDWSGWIGSAEAARWSFQEWPLGGMTAGALAGGEAFKTVMRKLRGYRRHEVFDEQFAPTSSCAVSLAACGTPKARDFGRVDLVSGGAVTHAALYALARVRGASGEMRIIEHDLNDITNANRYMLFLLKRLGWPKARDLVERDWGDLRVTSIENRFTADLMNENDTLAESVLVGVDDIPVRWEVQRYARGWLGIGATTHYQLTVTAHTSGLACARCGHPEDDPMQGPIATVSFVSLWAGLILAATFLQRAAGQAIDPTAQQLFFSPLRPEHPLERLPIPFRFSNCPCPNVQAGR